MQKNSVNRSIKTIFLNFTRKVCSGAKMGQNWPYLAQNTCFLRFCAFGCVISESSIWIKFLLFDCGYFGIYGIFVRPLDKILHIRERPFIFESISKKIKKSKKMKKCQKLVQFFSLGLAKQKKNIFARLIIESRMVLNQVELASE